MNHTSSVTHVCEWKGEPVLTSTETCPECQKAYPLLDGFRSFAPDLANTLSGFDPEGFQALAAIEKDHFWFRARNKIIRFVYRRFFSPKGNFLEVGCGTGFVLNGLSQEFPNLNLFGSEIHTKGLAFARQRVPTAQLFQMDARSIPFQQSFDVIGAFDVIEHIEEDQKVLNEFFKALKPNGGLLLTVPQHQFLWSAADEIAYHKRRYSRTELIRKVREAGFTVDYVSSFITMLFPLLYLSRLFHRQESHEEFRKRELSMPGGSAWLLEKICDLDFWALKRSWSLPFGGSLILVARKSRGSR